jgi:hypothetical protein
MKEKGKLLMSVVEEFKKTNPSETVTGFNSTKFDPHSLSTRLHVLGKMNSEVWNILHNRKWFDLHQFLGNDFQSLKLWLARFRVRRKYPELDGRECA